MTTSTGGAEQHLQRLSEIGFQLRPAWKCEAQPAAIVRVIAHAYANLPLQTRRGRERAKRTLCRYMQRRPPWIGTAGESRAPTEEEYDRAQRQFPTLSFQLPLWQQEQQAVASESAPAAVPVSAVAIETASPVTETAIREAPGAAAAPVAASPVSAAAPVTETPAPVAALPVSAVATAPVSAAVPVAAAAAAAPVAATPVTVTPVSAVPQYERQKQQRPELALSALVRPCTIGAVERCCLLGRERCEPYAVLHFDEAKYGNADGARILGEGVYGVVSLTDKGYVIKCGKREGDHDDVPQSDLREISILRNLVHPNVLTVDAVALAGTQTCDTQIIMSYYRQSFVDYLEANAPIVDPRTRARLLYQMLRGVAFLHSRGVWHRDLKPHNVLVDDQRVVLADFGLAQGVAIEGVAHLAGVITLWWRPPEILLGSQYYGANADVWSVGVMWLDMLDIRSLHGSSDNSQVLRIFLLLGRPEDHGWQADAEALPDWADYVAYEQSREDDAKVRPLAKRLRKLDHVTPAEVDLVRGLLAVNPLRRLDAFTALEHPFFDGVRDEVERAYPGPPLPTLAQVTCYDPLLAMELNPVGDYIARHRALNARMIDILLGFLSEVNAELHRFHTWSTFAASVDIFQRYMAKSKAVARSELQNVGVTCYMTASKISADAALNASTAYRYSPGSTEQHIATLERTVLLTLDADLDRPTAATFWQAFTRDTRRTNAAVMQSQSRLIAYLKTYEKSSRFRGSQLAYAALLGDEEDDENSLKSDCMRRYERLYPQFFNDDVVRQIHQS